MTLLKKALLLFGVVFYACSPGVGPEKIKDPRAYSWSADTLFHENASATDMENVWGSSPNDVYISGHSSISKPLYHFDGAAWNLVKLNDGPGPLFFPKTLLGDLFGLSANDVWATGAEIFDFGQDKPLGDSLLILHFDGLQWTKQHFDKREAGYMKAMWGTSKDNLWAGSTQGFLYKYDQGLWRTVPLDFKNKDIYRYSITSIAGNANGAAYMLVDKGLKPQGGTRGLYYSLKNGVWSLFSDIYGADVKIWVSPSGTLYSCGAGVRVWNGGSWEVIQGYGETEYGHVTNIFGTSDANIFITARTSGDDPMNGLVLQYNGKDWFTYEALSRKNAYYWGGWTDGAEVFITGDFGDEGIDKTIVWHGK